MDKIACIFSYQMSSWVSCQKIVFNLHKAYEANAQSKILNFNLSTNSTLIDLTQLAQNIFAADPDTIVILDHKPHPLPLFQILKQLYGTKKLPRIIFHIFGDFTLYYGAWGKLGTLLKGLKVDFVVASDRQKILLDKFLPAKNKSVVCPFPVSEKEFSYSPELRVSQRASWGLKDQEIAFVFTGRISYQKRIHTLIKQFAAAIIENKDQKAHLYIYGNQDKVGDPFCGRLENDGEYFRKVFRLYRSLSEEIQQRIHFMGNVPNSELKAVYHGADYFVNLSVHNDEDFGMSVAEAQCSGLPSVLTDWGGLASFHHESYPEATTFIPVKIGVSTKMISQKQVLKELGVIMKSSTNIDRKKISLLAQEKFGITRASAIMSDLLANENAGFEGFNDFFDEVSVKTQFSPMPYLDERKQLNHLYKKIYSAYVRHS